MNDFTKNNNARKAAELLAVNGLTVRFGGLTAVEKMEFRINSPGIRGVIGPNGAGKTTFFNTITGFVKAQEGRIIYQGEDILGMPPHVIAQKGIIRTFQNGGVFPEMSVIENVMVGYHRLFSSGVPGIIIGSKTAREEESDMIQRATRHLEAMGFGESLDQRAGDLSFGQQRIVEIARALFSKPKILFLDEPGAGLSTSEKNRLIEILRETVKLQEQYIVLTDHCMDLMMAICDFITVINFGVKICEGTPQEIQNNKDVIEAYLGKDFGTC